MDGGPSVISVPGSILSGGTEHDEAFSESAAGAALPTGVHLQLLFQDYCRFGRSGTDHDIDTLDNAMYAKFTRDCPGLLARPLSAADCDLLFVKHKAKPLRRITYGQVRGACRTCAQRSGALLPAAAPTHSPPCHTRTPTHATPPATGSGWTFCLKWQPSSTLTPARARAPPP